MASTHLICVLRCVFEVLAVESVSLFTLIMTGAVSDIYNLFLPRHNSKLIKDIFSWQYDEVEITLRISAIEL